MEDAEAPPRGAAKALSALLSRLSLIFGCALSIAKASLKLGVIIASCNENYLADFFYCSNSSALSSRYHLV